MSESMEKSLALADRAPCSTMKRARDVGATIEKGLSAERALAELSESWGSNSSSNWKQKLLTITSVHNKWALYAGSLGNGSEFADSSGSCACNISFNGMVLSIRHGTY